MNWDEFYKKAAYDWSASTILKKMSMLENVGTAKEITDVIYALSDEGKKGTTQLLNRAIQHGIKFSGEELLDIWDICDQESINKAMYFSADKFTTEDLDTLSLCMNDEQIIEIAKKYNIKIPDEIYETHEEVLCQDTTMPISWEHFYEVFYDWNKDYAIKRSENLMDYGDEDEVMQVVYELYNANQDGANKFICKALDFGVRFNADNLVELSCICDKETVELAVKKSSSMLDQDDLEVLYGNIEDELLKYVAQKRHLKLPETIQEIDEGYIGDDEIYVTKSSYSLGGFLRSLFGRRTKTPKKPLFTEEESFFYGVHPDDEIYRKTMELDILGKDYRE